MAHIKHYYEHQRGMMILRPDGAILKSSGELANDEDKAKTFANLLSYPFPINLSIFSKRSDRASSSSPRNVSRNQNRLSVSFPGPSTSTSRSLTPSPTRIQVKLESLKKSISASLRRAASKVSIQSLSKDDTGLVQWKRMLVQTSEETYILCVSDKKIHVVQRSHFCHSSDSGSADPPPSFSVPKRESSGSGSSTYSFPRPKTAYLPI